MYVWLVYFKEVTVSRTYRDIEQYKMKAFWENFWATNGYIPHAMRNVPPEYDRPQSYYLRGCKTWYKRHVSQVDRYHLNWAVRDGKDLPVIKKHVIWDLE